MLKLAGAVLIAIGCFGLGLWKREQLLTRVTFLKELEQLLIQLISEIRYGNATLPECCGKISKYRKEPIQSCLNNIYSRMQDNTGESFEKVFEQSFLVCFGELPVTKEDQEKFLGFVKAGSFLEGRMQISAIEQSRENIHNTVVGLEKENAEKCKVAVGLGAMSGLLLLIVLL